MGKLWRLLLGCFIARSGVGEVTADGVSVTTWNDEINDSVYLPNYLHGIPERKELHVYSSSSNKRAPHTASGPGLESAVAGEKASFTIQLAHEDGTPAQDPGLWNLHPGILIYVWIANENHIFIAEVENNGDGTLTASYSSQFVGTYLVHIDDVHISGKERSRNERGLPIMGSPFELTISGEPTAPDLDALPLCIDADDEELPLFWRSGSWISSRIASAKHGVMRNGWVFQPEDCAYETFSYDDLMAIANRDETTWLLILGGSVQRGLFLSLVDMVLANGEKKRLRESALQKCWGWSDIRVGNLRLSYQDMRLWRMTSTDDAVVCNDEKLASGSTAKYLRDAEDAFRFHFFVDGSPWPDVIATPTYVVGGVSSRTHDTQVVLRSVPAEWTGKVVFLEHNSAYGYSWFSDNPTRKAWKDVSPSRFAHGAKSVAASNGILKKIQQIQESDVRVTFMSTLPMYQVILFENQETFDGKKLCYGCSQHYHRTSKEQAVEETHNSSVMVQSMVTEMVGNVILSIALGTKKGLPPSSAVKRVKGEEKETSLSRSHFEMCTDCPRSLVPFHVKPVPDPSCSTLSSLPRDTAQHAAWNEELCPAWCLNGTAPTGYVGTESGVVDVRECHSPKHNL